ncbi:hypothetical protein Tco_1137555, partial [Tanacetum coccineum]
QVDEYDLEEIDLKWQVAMISMRIKKFYKKTGRKLQFDAKEPVGFARECRTKEDNRRRDGWNPGNKDGSRTGKKEESKALVTVDGESVDWTTHSEDDENFAFMASNSSGSDTQVPSCSNEWKESYANLKRLYDAQREQLSDASVEIKAYTQGLKKVEAQLVAHQQGQLCYSVGLLSRFMQEPKEQHMKAVKQVLRYVKGTKNYGITYKHNGGNIIQGFSDSSYGVNTQEGKGTTGINLKK